VESTPAFKRITAWSPYATKYRASRYHNGPSGNFTGGVTGNAAGGNFGGRNADGTRKPWRNANSKLGIWAVRGTCV
jgi:hypothetical protein